MADLDLLVLGSGVAGLSAAVRAASAGMRVGVLSKAELAQSATRWAQGGVAAVLSSDEDSTDLHLADTLAVGAGLCDVDAVRVLVAEGPSRVNELIALGAVFDRDHDGRLLLAREGGHSMPRVVHAGGAATGAEIERALVEAVKETATELYEDWFALDLLRSGDRCTGVLAVDPDGVSREVQAGHVLLATGGAGQVYAVTTNPVQSTGDGVAMALRAGVAVADVEFMQFHPTALHHPAMPRPLLSEALRGHGALIRDAKGDRFVDELQPRDVVSRAMTARMLGGVVTDLDGATTMPGLWACGEVACTGVHGANRLASNSLLEGMVFAPRVVEAVEAGKAEPSPTGAMAAVLAGTVMPLERPRGGTGESDDREVLQHTMTEGAGVLRDAASLERAAAVMGGMAGGADPELANLVTVAAAMVAAARAREESRGNHWRRDFPETRDEFRVRLVFR